MKKLVLAVICIIGFQSAFAQESGSSTTIITSSKDTIPGLNLYVAFGAAFNGDYKLNDKLAAQGLPQMSDTQFEATIGFNVRATRKFWMDFEVLAAYSDEKDAVNRVRTATFGGTIRPHYVAFNTKGFFGTVGADISYIGNQVDIFTRGNVIDLNALDPAFHGGHISLRNELLYAGPSLSFGFLQNTGFPLRLNLGYEWAITNGKWKSDFANVNNNVNESGHNRAYAKLTIGL
ncbi:MAG: hypothetical protein ACO1N9_12920 [Flavobacterium sp.]